MAVVSCLAGLALWADGAASSAAGQQAGELVAGSVRPAAVVTTEYFSGTSQPDQLVTTDGQVWLVSSGNSNDTGCRIGRLNPVTMALTSYPLSACGFNVTAVPGAIFLETTVADVKSETYAIHIERFSTSTYVSTVFGTVPATMGLGSDIAHTQLAYVAGSLWFYAWFNGRAEVLELSTGTGAVKRVFRSVPQIGGTEPIIVGTPGYIWLAGGAGSAADFLRIDVRSGARRTVESPGKFASVYELASSGGSLFFLYLGYPSSTSPTSTSPARVALTAHVGHFNANGELLKVSPNEQLGTWLVPLSGSMFSVGPGSSCTPPVLVWGVDEQTLRTGVVTRLWPPGLDRRHCDPADQADEHDQAHVPALAPGERRLEPLPDDAEDLAHVTNDRATVPMPAHRIVLSRAPQ